MTRNGIFSKLKNDAPEDAPGGAQRGPQKKDPDAPKVCLWEYGRECGPLIELAREFKEIIASEFRLDDEIEIARLAYRCLRRKNRLLPLPWGVTE